MKEGTDKNWALWTGASVYANEGGQLSKWEFPAHQEISSEKFFLKKHHAWQRVGGRGNLQKNCERGWKQWNGKNSTSLGILTLMENLQTWESL